MTTVEDTTRELPDDARARFEVLRLSADASVAAAIEQLARSGSDRALNRINALDFARKRGLNEDRVVNAFVHASRLGLFDMSWNLLCPGCGGVLDASASLKSVDKNDYPCAICAADYAPTLDEMVEVSFTVSQRVRRIGAHDPDRLPMFEYLRQIFWSSGMDLTDEQFDMMLEKVLLDSVELRPGEKCILSVQLPEAFVIVFDPGTHSAQFIDVKGEPTRERQELTVVYNKVHAHTGTVEMRPGPLRLTIENRTDKRALTGLYIAGDDLHHAISKRKVFLTAKRLLTNQAFQDIYRADALDVNQRLRITSLTVLFSDLKGSTELYERVGDLVAYDLVQSHFRVLNEAIAMESGAVVKTIGDAVMATFPTPDRGLAAALRMREVIKGVGGGKAGDLTVKIGLHEGPCLAVMLNERLDYFGQTVNIAARVQGLCQSRSIFATKPVVEEPQAARLLSSAGLSPIAQSANLRGISDALTVYEIP
jgi:class 3 adenylate cyclase